MELSSNHKLQNGKYKIISKIGQGGFGITYQAEWQTEVIGSMGKMNTAIPVAIKEFFFEEYCSRENGNSVVTITSATGKDFFDKFKNKLKKEALILSKLQHPNIVRVLDVFEENNTAYIVMAFVNGESLKDNIRNSGKLDENTALRYIGQLCDALAEIHNNKILHLDIKPNNILIDENDNVQLIDFGISKQYNDSHQETSTTPIGISKGFAPYEQYSGVQEFSPSTDIYAIGATLYNMLTGQIPVESIRLIDEPLKPIHDYNNQISEQTVSTIRKAMSMRRSDRQQSVEELSQGLSAVSSPKEQPDKMSDNTLLIPKQEEPKTELLESKPEVISSPGIQSPGKERHKFVTFWLWLMLVGHFIAAFGLAFGANGDYDSFQYYKLNFSDNQWAMDLYYVYFIAMLIAGIAALANTVFFIMLLKWKRIGFWLIAISTIAAAIFTGIIVPSISVFIITLFLALAGVGILYGILQIKENKISCWDNLE